MTDKEIMQMALDVLEKLNKDGWILADFEDEVYASIEALRARLAQPEPEELGEIVPADKEQLKRIAKLVEPEPVAWYYAGSRVEPESVALNCDLLDAEKANCTPLYTAPPQREWQGLTDEEIEDACWTEVDQRLRSFARAIEAKLKEKNA